MNTEVGQRLGQVDHIAALAELQPVGNVGQPEDRHTVIAEEYAAAFSIENIGSPEHHGRELADDVHDIDDAILDQRCPGNRQIGRAPCRERVWQYVWISVVDVSLNNKTQRQQDVRREYANNTQEKIVEQ